jgi:hypothetical protein
VAEFSLEGTLAILTTEAPVAQLDRAPDFESGGRRFNSFRAHHYFNDL